MQPYNPLFVDADHTATLQRVVDTFRSAPAPKIAVFDLDSTLFDNRPRQVKILHEYGAKRGIKEMARVQAQHFLDWDLVGPLVRSGFSRDEAERLFPDLKAFWREVFFTSPYCLLDVALPGASRFVTHLHGLGATVVYLTGRHEAMRAGSHDSLAHAEFPVPGTERVHLLMKPSLEIDDTDYKKSAFEQIRKLGPVLAGFDNEPAHANALKTGFPEAMIVWMQTDRSPATDAPRPDLLKAHGYMGVNYVGLTFDGGA